MLCAKGSPFETEQRLRLSQVTTPPTAKSKDSTARPETTPAQRKPASYRLLPEAHSRIVQSAKAAGISPRAWLETAILENKTSIVARQRPHPDLGPLLFQTRQAGNNLNQIARKLNQRDLIGELSPTDIEEALQLLERLHGLFKRALDRAR